MTFTELFTREKESMQAALIKARDPAQAGAVVSAALDRMLLQYNESCDEERLRTAAADMVQTVRMTLGFMDTADEPRVWEKASGRRRGMRKMTLSAWILTVIGILCLVCLAGSALLAEDIVFPGTLLRMISLILFAAGGAFTLFFAGVQFASSPERTKKPGDNRSSSVETAYMVEIKPDADKILSSLHGIVLMIDQNLKKHADYLAGERFRKEKSGEDYQMEDNGLVSLELLSSLLEAYESGDPAFALEQTGQIRYYLHRQGIETLELTDETRQWFDIIPGMQKRTVRPALVKDGAVIKKGLATGG